MLWRTLLEAQVAIGNYYRPRAELLEIQRRKLRSTVRYAFDNVPLYHRWFRDRGMVPDDVNGLSDLARLPILTRDEIRKSFPGDITVRGAPVGMTLTTSGTTSSGPLRVQRGVRYSDVLLALQIRKMWVGGVRPWWKTPLFQVQGPDIPFNRYTPAVVMWRLMFRSFALHVVTLRPKRIDLRAGRVRTAALEFYAYRPQVVQMPPTFLRRVGYMLRDEGKSLDMKLVFAGNEPLTRACRRELMDLYRCDVLDIYGATELGILGYECRAHRGIHLNSDYFAFELTRGDGPASEGESSDVVVTTLENEAMPILRYRLEDMVVVGGDEKCDCGSSLPRLARVEGRRKSRLVAADGALIPASYVTESLEGRYGIRDYQVVQRKGDAILLRLRKEDDTKENLAALSGFFSQLLGARQSVETEEWDLEEMPVKYLAVSTDLASGD